MSTQKKPWQVAPTKFIKHAIEHADSDTDFDKQMAFLVLDVGVENIFKTFLDKYEHNELKRIQKEAAKNGHDVSFFTIAKTVKEAKNEKIPEFDPQIVNHYHEVRNTLYHDRARSKPLDEDLKNYIEIAKILLNSLLDVDINEEQPRRNTSQFSLLGIQKNIISLLSNSALMAEHLYPQISTRKIEAQLRHIRIVTGPKAGDDSSVPLSVQAGMQEQRIEIFNKITGWEFTEDENEFVEYIIDNPEQLNVWLAFQEISSDNWHKEWTHYQWSLSFLEYEQSYKSKADTERYKELYEWTHEKASNVWQWVKDHIPDSEPKSPDIYIKSLKDFFD